MSNRKVLKRRWLLILLLVVTLPFSSPATPLSSYDLCATPMLNANPDPLTDNEWRIYDVNGDGKFDVTDIDEFVGRGGIGFVNDLNSDGNRDLTDAFALYVKLSVLDRNCDEAVDNNDFTPIDPVEMPEPDAAVVWPLVSRIVAEALKKLPPDIENQVFMSLPESGAMTFIEKAYVYQETGMSALLQLNLEGAQWAYGRAFQTNNRSSTALGSLAFTIAVDKRHEEALTLLAYARDLFRESGATSTTVGWIFARHGQNREALIYYQEAVQFAPKIARYHMNLGIAYMRVGSTKKACEEFRIASELDPGDFHALLFRHVVPEEIPPQKTPIDLNNLKEEDELQIKELRDYGATDDELPTPWDECSPCEQARKIPEILGNKYGDKIEKIGQSYADELAEKANEVAMAHAPKWKKLSEDYMNWEAAIKWGKTTGKALELDAEIAYGNIMASLTRQLGNDIMSYSSFYMECALKQAEADANQGFQELYSRTKDLPVTAGYYADVKEDIYQSSLEEAINQCYKDPMITGASSLKAKSEPATLPLSHVEIYPIVYYIFAIPGACLSIPGYCDETDPGNLSFPNLLDNTFSLNLWIASFEYNYDTGAWELRVAPGTGIILGATWSPESGFGYQAGADLDVDLGVAGFGLEGYFEVDKNGMHLKGEISAFVNLGIFEAGMEKSGTHTLIPFQAAPGEATPLLETE
jgi:hypothetical protein